MTDTQADSLEITLGEIRRGDPVQGYEPVVVASSRGEMHFRYYPVAGAGRAAVFVGGTGGGWDSPGRGELYPRLCSELNEAGIAALRVCYRRPGELEESVLDVMAGLHFLGMQGVTRHAVVGHSFGGAVAAQAAANTDDVRALVTIATQSQALDAVRALPEDCASLFIHGADDPILPPSCSKYGYNLAREPRYLRIFGGAGHCLDEVADDLRQELREWLLGELLAA